MRILLISRCPPYPIHLGDRLIIYHLARELSRRGHEIDLLAFANRPEDWDDYPWPGRAVRDYFQHVELVAEPRRRPLDYLVRALIPSKRFPRRAGEAWAPAMWGAIEARLAQARYDVAHVFGGVQVYEFWGALGHTPAIIVPYESYSLYLRRTVEIGAGSVWQTLSSRLQWRMAQSFERWMFTPYRRVVVVSGRDKEELLMLNPALPVEVIPNGVDLGYFQWQRATREAETLLFVGNFEYAPNVDAALRLVREILPKVREHCPGAKLWLVGNAPPPAFKAVEDEGVTVTGRVPDVRPFLARATVFVCPLRLGAGIKNKVLEALAMGLPVVATPLSVDGIEVQPGRDALIVRDDELAEAVVRVLQDAALRERLSTSGRALVAAQYSWEQVAARYEALYAAL